MRLSITQFGNLPISYKVTLLGTLTGLVAVISCLLAFVIIDARAMRRSTMAYCAALGELLSQNCIQALESNDQDELSRALASLKVAPAIVHVEVFDARGRSLASWSPPASTKQAPQISRGNESRNRQVVENGLLHIRRPVTHDARRLGVVTLDVQLEPFAATRAEFVTAAVGILMMCTLLAALLAMRLQRSIDQPLQNLAELARDVSDTANYGMRVEMASDDEVGRLADVFNAMLGRIQERETELEEHRSHLEDLVGERTKALERKTEEALAACVAKSQFLANMSHEIRTPLNAILGFTDLLRRGVDGGSERERQEYLDIIHTSGQHLLALINDILDLSKIEAGRMEIELISTAPHQVIAEAISVMRVPAVQKGLTLEYNWVGNVPSTIRTDPARLRQILMNLIGNAVKFTESGGVRVLAEVVQHDGDPMLKIDVIDTGIGIPQASLERIFQPFTQADASVTRQFGGTGLGLTICRRIAKELGGYLTVVSEPGHGSVFTIQIPTGPLDDVQWLSLPPVADVVSSADYTDRANPPTLRPAKVLLVEDGDTNRRLIRLILQRHGLEVMEAVNGKVGVNLANQHDFDLILMDMQMPVMDGYTAAAELRRKGLMAPIVALTAHAMKGDEEKCRAAGCTDYLTKPIQESRLVSKLAEYLGDSRGSKTAASETDELPLAKLRSSLPTEDPDYREIVEEFIQQVQSRMAEMRQLAAIHNDAELARMAHWLKGTGGTAGFQQFTRPALRLERAAKSSDAPEIEATLNDLESLVARLEVPQPAATFVR